MKILGIETSCDETGAAVIDAANARAGSKDHCYVLSNVLATSLPLHGTTGGIIPEIAAREQIKYSIPVIKQALGQANITHPEKELDAIAVTIGPGLIGSLLVGVETAKALAFVWNKPLIPVNHLFGHIYANWIEPKFLPHSISKKAPISFPALALVVSGGHTDLVLIQQHQQVKWLGGTRDDAAGEALDKIGRLLGLPYPGGPAIEQQAKQGTPKAFRFPRPLMHDGSFDFSFSGLKTAVLREVQKEKTLSPQCIANVSHATQDAVIDVLVTKTWNALKKYSVQSLLLSGGVSANQTLRDAFRSKIEEQNTSINFFAPEKELCTDNAAMIAAAGFYNPTTIPWQQISANPELYFD